MEKRIIFKCITGSQAYGTNVEGSDVDIKGIYVQDPMEILTFGYKPQIDVNKDEVYYEVRRFLELLGSANPTVLEMLYMPDDCILEKTPEFDLIWEKRHHFLTKRCRNSFGGYAIGQIKKARGLDKKMNWEKADMVRKTPLDFCYRFDEQTSTSMPLKEWLDKWGYLQEYCGLSSIDHIRDGYGLYYDFYGAHMGMEPIGLKGIVLQDSNSIRLSEVPKDETCYGFVHYNKDGYTQHCNKFKEYEEWLKNRNTQRYVDLEEHGQQIDGKNMLHCTRVLETAVEIANEGTIHVRRWNAPYLIDIRKGKVDLETILNNAEHNILKMDEAFDNSDLPEQVPEGLCNDILTKIRQYEQPV